MYRKIIKVIIEKQFPVSGPQKSPLGRSGNWPLATDHWVVQFPVLSSQ
jgi:hypothetical protein